MKFSCKSFTDGYYMLNNHLFFLDRYDHIRGGVTAHKFDVTMESESCDCRLHLHDFNYTNNKWKMLNNLYLDPQEIGVFVARIQHYMGQTKHKKYVPDIAMQFKTRRNVSGACLLSISLGYNRDKWRCFIHTRASELTCRWPMDLIFINRFLKAIGDTLGIDYLQIAISWHMISTYQSITSMPYFLVLAGKEDWLEESISELDSPMSELSEWQKYTVKRYVKCYQGGAYTSYRVQRRPMEAYQMLKGEMQRKQYIYTQDLSIGIVPFKGTFEDDYDETDILHMDKEILTQLMREAKEEDLFGKGGYR